jgi:tRNA threonylcarbamoyladenosine modification (KEOPS) complex  Pcc1 subunit
VLLNPLAQELKASLDYFEAQAEQKISVVFVSGGSARSPLLVELLEKQVHLPCRAWHLADSVSLGLSAERAAAFKRELPQFVAAVGAAMDCLGAVPRGLNLLASQLAEAQKRQRSPARIGLAVAALLTALMLVWSAVLGWQLMAENSAIRSYQSELVEHRAMETRVFQKLHGENERTAKLLSEQATARFLVAPALDALQRSVVEDIVVTKLTAQRNRMKLVRDGKRQDHETILLNIQAKDYSELGATDAFIDAIASNPYFKRRLPGAEAVSLKQRSSRQADTANPARSFALVTIECLLLE